MAGAVERKMVHPTDCSGIVGGGDALVGCVEAHEGRGVRNTSDRMTTIGVGSGDHDVSKSRQAAAS